MDNPPNFVRPDVAYHCCCPVFNIDRRNVQVYRSMDDKFDKFNKIRHEGVYFYGGVNQEGVV